jgi:hypothetical protein
MLHALVGGGKSCIPCKLLVVCMLRVALRSHMTHDVTQLTPIDNM